MVGSIRCGRCRRPVPIPAYALMPTRGLQTVHCRSCGENTELEFWPSVVSRMAGLFAGVSVGRWGLGRFQPPEVPDATTFVFILLVAGLAWFVVEAVCHRLYYRAGD